jgi:hypothetical protein
LVHANPSPADQVDGFFILYIILYVIARFFIRPACFGPSPNESIPMSPPEWATEHERADAPIHPSRTPAPGHLPCFQTSTGWELINLLFSNIKPKVFQKTA